MSQSESVVMEVCVDNLESAYAAMHAGACQELSDGGYTPTAGMLRAVQWCRNNMEPVSVLLRPRGSDDFVYSEAQIKVMQYDVELLNKTYAKGVSLGVLKPDGLSLDEEACRRLIREADYMPVTLNGAFDYAVARGADPVTLLFAAQALGFKRVVTSGGGASAEEGKDVIRRLVHHAGNHIVVMPRGGLTEGNLESVLSHTGAAAFQVCADDLRPADEVEADASATPRVLCEDRIKRLQDIARAHVPYCFNRN